MERLLLVLLTSVGLLHLLASNAAAHQPFFEDSDLTYDAPYLIRDPNISLAYYATLENANDADYYVFDGQQGQRVLLELAIPQVVGQENFAPTMALLGPGLPAKTLPARVRVPEKDGMLILEPPTTARTFYEPFSGTSYWQRQREFVTLPSTGRYHLAVWHPQGAVGRYVFVTGTREEFGGDLAFPIKMRQYWTSVTQPPLWEKMCRCDRD